MLIVRNDILPLRGYKAMTLWPLLFVRRDCIMTDVDLRHERIHARQQKELLVVFFYLIYIIEYLVRLWLTFSTRSAYRDLSFEKEAYSHEHDEEYLRSRPLFAMWKR